MLAWINPYYDGCQMAIFFYRHSYVDEKHLWKLISSGEDSMAHLTHSDMESNHIGGSEHKIPK